MIKRIQYIRNDDGTFRVFYEQDCVPPYGNLVLEYPRVNIDWYFPERSDYYAVPIPSGVNVLPDTSENKVLLSFSELI